MNQITMSELKIRGAVSSALDDYYAGTSRELALENAILGVMTEDDPMAAEVIDRFDEIVKEDLRLVGGGEMINKELQLVHDQARRVSERLSQEEFVVRDGGVYDYCDAWDLETYYAGADIVAVYNCGERED